MTLCGPDSCTYVLATAPAAPNACVVNAPALYCVVRARCVLRVRWKRCRREVDTGGSHHTECAILQPTAPPLLRLMPRPYTNCINARCTVLRLLVVALTSG